MTQAGKKTHEGFWAATLVSLLGPLIWTLHFGLVYGVQHVACASFASGSESLFVKIFILVATVLALVILVIFGATPIAKETLARITNIGPERATFLTRVSRLLTLLSAFGIFWEGAAVLFLAQCGALR